MIEGFKNFIARGNAVEMAVGIVIGAAFGAVVESVTERVLNPIIGAIFGQPNLDTFLQFTLGDSLVQPGAVLTALINFLLVALAVYFLIVVPMNKLSELTKKAEEVAEEEAAADIALLTEIRDLLAKNAAN